MAGRGHRDIFADDMAWPKGTLPGFAYTRLLMDEDDTSSPLIILSRFELGETVEPHTLGTNYFQLAN